MIIILFSILLRFAPNVKSKSDRIDFLFLRMLTVSNERAGNMKRTVFVLLLALLLTAPVFADEADKGWLALTFDDGPSGELTETLLEGLREQNVKATFFVCGYRVEDYPLALCHIAEAGHEIGLHSCCHDYMQKMTKAEAVRDLKNCRELVERTCGVRAHLFRPPGGLYSSDLLDAAQELDLSVILWSVDPQDWDARFTKAARRHVDEHAFPGAVILMHELSMESVEAALGVVADLKQEGYRFCTVSELAEHCGKTPEAGGVYSCFG